MTGLLSADVLVGSTDDLNLTLNDDPFLMGREIAGDRLRWVGTTDGAMGARAYDGARMLSAGAVKATVRDTTGAGDCFGAGLLDALTDGADMIDALFHAAAWGANAVELRASTPLHPEPGMFAPYGAR